MSAIAKDAKKNVENESEITLLNVSMSIRERSNTITIFRKDNITCDNEIDDDEREDRTRPSPDPNVDGRSTKKW